MSTFFAVYVSIEISNHTRVLYLIRSSAGAEFKNFLQYKIMNDDLNPCIIHN